MKTVVTILILALSITYCTPNERKHILAGESKSELMPGDTIRNRKPAVAGTFYPAGRETLQKSVETCFASASASKNLSGIKAIISPHAGYVYSGNIAASAFNQLDPDYSYDNIFLIGSSHQFSFDGAAIYNDGNFQTPLGMIRVNLELANEILNKNPDIFVSNPKVQETEHSLEVQLPFLQYVYQQNLQIVPIIIATQNPGTVEKIAEALSSYFKDNNLFVISTDFSHYPDYLNAIKIDRRTASSIIKNSPREFLKVLDENSARQIPNLSTSVCGWTSMLALLDITQFYPGISYHEIVYRNSGDAEAGDKHRVVGYHAMVVTGSNDPEILTEIEKKALLHIARVSITEYLETGKMRDAGLIEGITEKLKKHAGAFVTLTKDHELKGCIGQFNADKPLYRIIQEMAVSAATRDYRFPELKRSELDQIKIEISVLSPMRRIQSINEIVPGKHGIYIKKGNQNGTYLPQVATQMQWSAEEFVIHCAREKARIADDGWKEAELFVYEANVFGE